MKLQMNPAIMKVASRPQLALLILQGFGLIQMPIVVYLLWQSFMK